MKIKIEGSGGTGKTTVARIVRDALESHGIECSVSESEQAEIEQQDPATFGLAQSSLRSRGVVVSLETVQVRA